MAAVLLAEPPDEPIRRDADEIAARLYWLLGRALEQDLRAESP